MKNFAFAAGAFLLLSLGLVYSLYMSGAVGPSHPDDVMEGWHVMAKEDGSDSYALRNWMHSTGGQWGARPTKFSFVVSRGTFDWDIAMGIEINRTGLKKTERFVVDYEFLPSGYRMAVFADLLEDRTHIRLNLDPEEISTLLRLFQTEDVWLVKIVNGDGDRVNYRMKLDGGDTAVPQFIKSTVKNSPGV